MYYSIIVLTVQFKSKGETLRELLSLEGFSIATELGTAAEV